MDCSPPGSSVHGILQARVLEWVAISFSRDLPDPGIEPGSPVLADGFFTTEPPGKPSKAGGTTRGNVPNVCLSRACLCRCGGTHLRGAVSPQ